jgi:lysophospholipase L1-like esterase
LPGIGIKSDASNGSLQIQLKKDSLLNPYTSGFIMYSMVEKEKGKITVNQTFQKVNQGLFFDTLAFSSNSPTTSFNLSHSETPITFHGAYFENNQKGVIYNSFGVAGARYKDYFQTELFAQQLPLLKPDLLIISLGTNESFDPNYSDKEFENILDSMFRIVQGLKTAVLITGPSECYRMVSKLPAKNQKIETINQILRQKCQQFGFAFWDLSIAMGGEGSMLKWKEAGLVNNDHIHFLKKGYNLQGKLLFEAINKNL